MHGSPEFPQHATELRRGSHGLCPLSIFLKFINYSAINLSLAMKSGGRPEKSIGRRLDGSANISICGFISEKNPCRWVFRYGQSDAAAGWLPYRPKIVFN